jgi:hypothetical protein
MCQPLPKQAMEALAIIAIAMNRIKSSSGSVDE